MEIPGVGVLSYDAPPEEWKPFMRRKIYSLIRNWEANKDGRVERDLVKRQIEKHVQMLPAEEREDAIRKRTEIWNYVLLCDKKEDSIPEEECVDIWISRMYAKSEDRKRQMNITKEFAYTFFEQLDLNSDGCVDFSEWRKGFGEINDEGAKASFNIIDVNKDGVLSKEEWVFAALSYHFCSGPDDPYSLLFGPIYSE